MGSPETESSGRVLGRYVLYDEIGSGGMASVHLGRLVGPSGFSRTVAIKRMHPQLARDPEFAAMFLDEARLAARVQHPNVVPIIDVVSLAGELFIVMEYIQGESLARLLRADRPPLDVALAILTDLLYGLHAAHEAKSESGEPLLIVHRDVSPHNVMVGADGVSRVLDFGLAKATSRTQHTGSNLRGKFAYISPEQVQRKPIDRRADVFAAGIVAWEVLTGERLFAAEDGAASIARVLSDPIEPPSRRVPALPPALDAIVLRALERDPAQRFPSAEAMARALEDFARPARPSEVAAWVAKSAGERLRERALRVERIERESPLPPATTGDGIDASVPTARLAPAEDDVSSVEVSAPSVSGIEPRARTSRGGARRRAAVVAGVIALVGAGLVFASTRRAPAAPTATATATASPTSTSTAAPVETGAGSAAGAASAATSTSPTHVAHPVAPVTKRRPSGCDPPYYFDAQGVKRFKDRCL